MNKQDFANVIVMVRRAPLDNMDHAESVNKLLQKFAMHADEYLALHADDAPAAPDLKAVDS